MKWNLKNRILVPTLALVVVTTAAISGVSYLISQSTMTKTLDDQLEQICSSSMRQIETWVDGQRTNLIHWSTQPHILKALDDTPEGLVARTAVVTELSNAAKLYGIFANLQLVDTKGDTLASSNPESIGKLNVSDRQYFKDASAGNVAISQVLKSRTTGNPIVVLAVPVKDGSTVRGVLFASLDLNVLSSDLIARIKVLQTGYAYLFDETGVFIAHPNKAKIMTTKLEDFDWGRVMLQMKTGKIHYTFDGVEKVAIFHTSETLHWGLATTLPMSELLATTKRMGRINLILGISALLIGFGAMWFTARSITGPITGVAEQLASGSRETSSAAEQVSSASQSLAQGATEQAASLEETSASLEEMSGVTNRNAESTSKASELARQARKAADTGAEDMHSMTSAMQDIKTSSDDIAKIIKTIDEIAFQTNILALNAAVEAARAGEAGLGFAVVADEVRALAQRAANAAHETADKIEGAITKTAQGVQISDKVSKSLAEIVEKVRQVDELVAEVNTASHEQSEGVKQIATAVHQMDQVVQANAAGAEESASASEELNAQSLTLQHIVEELHDLIQGTTTRTNQDEPAETAKSPIPSTKSAQSAFSVSTRPNRNRRN